MRNIIRLLSILILGGLLSSCGNPNIETSSATSPKAIVENHGVNIEYADTGTGDTILLFVHGWCINKTYWNKQVDFFSSRYRVVTVDLPGFGESGKNRKVWTAQIFGEDIDSVIARLNLKNVILIGHSMAGHIVLEAASHFPDRVIGLIGVDNFKQFGAIETKEEKEQTIKALDSMKKNFRPIAFQYINQYLFIKTTADSIRKRVWNDVTKADSSIAIACLEPDDFDEVKKMSDLKMKLCLVNSDYTATDTTGFITNHIPYQIFYIHQTGHFPMVEKPEEFNLLLEQAIAKVKN
jgi:pimeloyl-ACP methyl ester carboxylesterase